VFAQQALEVKQLGLQQGTVYARPELLLLCAESVAAGLCRYVYVISVSVCFVSLSYCKCRGFL
jgi:hypothetical protein